MQTMQRITKSCVLPLLLPARTWFLLIKDFFITSSSSSSFQLAPGSSS